jgi:hypothetical protein
MVAAAEAEVDRAAAVAGAVVEAHGGPADAEDDRGFGVFDARRLDDDGLRTVGRDVVPGAVAVVAIIVPAAVVVPLWAVVAPVDVTIVAVAAALAPVVPAGLAVGVVALSAMSVFGRRAGLLVEVVGARRSRNDEQHGSDDDGLQDVPHGNTSFRYGNLSRLPLVIFVYYIIPIIFVKHGNPLL